MRATRTTVALCLIVTAAAARGAIAGGDEDAREKGRVVETIDVERVEAKGSKHPSLRFLRDNRDFLRAQLDRLHTQIVHERSEDAELLDERFLRLREMSDAIAAARDTVGTARDRSAERELLASIAELSTLEAELDRMERIHAEQRARLLLLEEDFLGHQESALVVVLKGLSGKRSPGSVALAEDGEIVRVDLTAAERNALEQGGVVQIYHEFVEPRAHVFHVRFDGEGWQGSPPVAVDVEAARDRLTFLELDLSRLDPDQEALGLLASVWYR